MPADLNKTYQQKHLRNTGRAMSRIRAIYEEAIHEITLVASFVTYRGGVFSLDKYPLLKKKVEAVLRGMHGSIYTAVVNSITASWDLSNEKNNLFVDKRLAGKTPAGKMAQILYDPNLSARDAFIVRKDHGLNLSGRVWNLLEPFRNELEQGLAIGMSEGQPAAEMARDLKKYLNEPDRLYRRVRDAKGNLKLSKAAREYRPGQGVYRSSFKNAMRLTRTETNTAYRTADFERWQKLDFVKGIEVRLSNAHPRYDMCDHLKGLYPKGFHFTGWHPQCLCNAIPVMATAEEYDQIEDHILGLSDKAPVIKGVESMPAGAKKWINSNAERINGWVSTPYWVKNNPGFVKELLKAAK